MKVSLSQLSQVRGILVEFSLVRSTGSLEGMLVAVLSGCRASEGQAGILLQQSQRGEPSAWPAALHLIHGLRHGGQGGRGWVGVQVRGRTEEGAVLKAVRRVGGNGRGVRGLTA